jgi:hypothetical protein
VSREIGCRKSSGVVILSNGVQDDGVTRVGEAAKASELAQLAVHLASRELQRTRDAAQRGARGTDGVAVTVTPPALLTPLVAASLELAASQRVAAAAFTRLREVRRGESALRAAVAVLTTAPVATGSGASRTVRLLRGSSTERRLAIRQRSC